MESCRGVNALGATIHEWGCSKQMQVAWEENWAVSMHWM